MLLPVPEGLGAALCCAAASRYASRYAWRYAGCGAFGYVALLELAAPGDPGPVWALAALAGQLGNDDA